MDHIQCFLRPISGYGEPVGDSLRVEDGYLSRGGEVRAAVAGGELHLAGEELVEPNKGHPEGEAILMLDPCAAARLVDAIHVWCR
jgi:hypothetical protein